MSLLQSLDRYYDRMAARGEAEDLGFTRENVSYALSFNKDGSVRDVLDLRVMSGRRLVPRRLSVPRPKRTSNVQGNFLWDKTAYAFGVDGGKSKRLIEEHNSFRTFQREMLAGIPGRHVEGFLTFLEAWQPARFREPPFTSEMVDASFVFRLEDEQLSSSRRAGAAGAMDRKPEGSERRQDHVPRDRTDGRARKRASHRQERRGRANGRRLSRLVQCDRLHLLQQAG